jgi:hypothetical protein
MHMRVGLGEEENLSWKGASTLGLAIPITELVHKHS